MRHPRCIAERRHNRLTVMARRRKVILRWFPHQENHKPENSAWRRCGNWNLACGCYLCSRQDSSFRRQRRRQFKRDVADNVSEWSDFAAFV